MKRAGRRALRWGLGALLVVAGALKLRDPGAFATEIANYQLLPALAPILAAALPLAEVLIGAALLLAPAGWRRPAALAAAALFVMFFLAVATAFARGINTECGCFGTGGGPITALTVLRNIVLIGAAAALLRWEPARTGAPT